MVTDITPVIHRSLYIILVSTMDLYIMDLYIMDVYIMYIMQINYSRSKTDVIYKN